MRWRITQYNASLAPTCPFCRKELHRLLPEPHAYSNGPNPVDLRSSDDFVDRLIMRMVQLLAYVLLGLVLLLLPLVESFLTQSDELFLAYFLLIVFVFVFLGCHYVHRYCPLSDDDADDDADDETAVLSRA